MKIVRAIAGAVKGRPRPVLVKSDAALWHEATNPLRGLTIQRAAQIYDYARQGCYADLAWLYQEIEAADPLLMTCVERRAAAVSELDWIIRKADAKKAGRAFDAALADEQTAYLYQAFGACDTLGAGIEHLAGAFFRGFAHVQPHYTADGLALERLDTLDAWNFVLNRAAGSWHWNAAAASVAKADGLPEIPGGELCSLVRPRHVDYPALHICIRVALGEKNYGVWLERYGVPPVLIVMPAFADRTEEELYMAAAEKVARGGSGALPHGSDPKYATEARGANPFDAFLKHQQELIVLMATGGLLTSLAAPGSGTLAGGAHEETWRTVVRRDARFIAEAIQRDIGRRLLDAQYPGRPRLAEFAFEMEASPTPGDVFKDGASARSAGYRISRQQLEERTGYTLEPEAAAPAGGAAPIVANKAGAPATEALAQAYGAAVGPEREAMGRILDLLSGEGDLTQEQVDQVQQILAGLGEKALSAEAIAPLAEEIEQAMRKAVAPVAQKASKEIPDAR